MGKNPIDPGKSLGGFRFCLPVLEKGVTISLTYDVGPALAAAVFLGSTVGSTVVRNARLYCATIRITAPDTPVSDIHFGGAVSPQFDDVSAPGWTVNATDKEVTIDASSGTPIPPGGTKDVDVCVKTKDAKIDYYLTDKDHKEIPNTKGTLAIK